MQRPQQIDFGNLFRQLPPEILIKIFSELQPKDLDRLNAANKTFYFFAHDPAYANYFNDLWHAYFRKNLSSYNYRKVVGGKKWNQIDWRKAFIHFHNAAEELNNDRLNERQFKILLCIKDNDLQGLKDLKFTPNDLSEVSIQDNITEFGRKEMLDYAYSLCAKVLPPTLLMEPSFKYKRNDQEILALLKESSTASEFFQNALKFRRFDLAKECIKFLLPRNACNAFQAAIQYNRMDFARETLKFISVENISHFLSTAAQLGQVDLSREIVLQIENNQEKFATLNSNQQLIKNFFLLL